jgi:SAM-dependent methyltransferase
MHDERAHWEATYAAKPSDQLSWYEAEPHRSLELIEEAGLERSAAVIDVGGGTSRLAAALLEIGYTDVTVADISSTALERAQAALGSAAGRIDWVQADVRNHDFGRTFDLWHDRAVLHFMVTPEDRSGYLRTLGRSLTPGGQVVISTFGPQGPTRCSGLPVIRYGADALADALGAGFTLRSSHIDVHRTPSGAEQQFLCARLALTARVRAA